jgi:hypothetical protein
MTRVISVLVLAAFIPAPVTAQLVVHDPAVTARNAITAVVKEYLIATQRAQRERIDFMAARLSRLTDLQKYSLPDAPEWRIHDFWDDDISLLARDYHAALNYGDGSGAALLAVSHAVTSPNGLLNRLPLDAFRAFTARLATVDATDSALIVGTNDAGLTRYNGRRELAAIEALEAQAIDGSDDQSTTAVAEKVSGATLIGNRQRQARLQLLSSVVEQLLMDSKRARDADTAAINMQLVAWRDRKAANEAFVAGTGDALRTWRQP